MKAKIAKSTEEISEAPEIRMKGLLAKKEVVISQKENADELSSKGYGTNENGKFTLAFCEALYLVDKGVLEIKDKSNCEVDFQALLKHFENVDGNAWIKYLAYRDLRSRGYVVREGFGLGVDFRVYERGEYGKDTAKYLILNIQEGKPVSLGDLTSALNQCQNLKKELILAVMNRRGEVVYYSVSKLNLA